MGRSSQRPFSTPCSSDSHLYRFHLWSDHVAAHPRTNPLLQTKENLDFRVRYRRLVSENVSNLLSLYILQYIDPGAGDSYKSQTSMKTSRT